MQLRTATCDDLQLLRHWDAPRRFGRDDCHVYRLDRESYLARSGPNAAVESGPARPTSS